MKFACPKCRTPHALADSELPPGRTFRFVCGSCGHTIGVRRKEEAAAAAAPVESAAPQAPLGSYANDPMATPPAPQPAAAAPHPAPGQAAPIKAQPTAARGAPPMSHAAQAVQHGAPAQAPPQHAAPAAATPRAATHPTEAHAPPAATRAAGLTAPTQGAPHPAPHSAPHPANKVQTVASHATESQTVALNPKPGAQLNPFHDTDPGTPKPKPPTPPPQPPQPKAAARAEVDLDAPDSSLDAADADFETGFDPDTDTDADLDLDDTPVEDSFLNDTERAYMEAPPGQATQLFMQTAGIYKRRKQQRIAAWSIGGALIAVCMLMTADVTGLVSIPLMGAVYDAAGMQDPDAHRAIERTKSQLSSSSLSATQRDELRHKLMGYDEVPVAAPAATRRHPAAERKPLEAPAAAAEIYSKMDKHEDTPEEAAAAAAADAAPAAGLSPEAITKVMQANSHAMTQCINEAARKGPAPTGKLEMQLVIAPSGEVKDVQIQTERFKNTPMGHCAAKRVKGWHFPRFTGEPMTVVFPYVLSGGA